ncbi:hypothetical protein [Deinococcus radiopugnans]|uniref:hypothetical protein n=1 Tax=Deinococcus radiopugnans TaxID=57497 RepID=UPI003B8A5E69
MGAGRRGVVHAKCAVADGRIALVTSANLTDAARPGTWSWAYSSEADGSLHV